MTYSSKGGTHIERHVELWICRILEHNEGQNLKGKNILCFTSRKCWVNFDGGCRLISQHLVGVKQSVLIPSESSFALIKGRYEA